MSATGVCHYGPVGGVFISYRRDDSQGSTGRLADRLHQLLGDDVPLFVDIDSIKPGQDFRKVIADTVDRCDVTLVMIGPRWAHVTDEDGQRRLDDPGDLHRLEVESSLASATTIPVLVEGARMPDPEDLPESIRELAYRHAAELSVRRFAADAEYLADLIRAELTPNDDAGESPTAPVPPVTTAPPPEAPRPPIAPSRVANDGVGSGTESAEPPDRGSRLDPRVLIGAVLALVAVVAIAAVIVLSSDDDPGTTAPEVTTTVATADEPITSDPNTIGVFDLEVGDCFDAVSTAPVFTVTLEPCSERHDNEVYSVWTSVSGSLPEDRDLLNACEGRFDDAVGIDYSRSVYWAAGFWPDEDSWADGNRTVICYGFARDAQGIPIETTGSMLGSGN